MDPVYYFILCIVGVLTAALTVLKITSMRKANGNTGQLNAKVVNIEQKLSRKRDIPFCDERHDNLQRELAKGQKQFEAILKVQSKQAEMLARIDERVEYLAEENGFSKRRKKQ